MAGADYRSCDVCGGKTFYDAHLDYNKPDEAHGYEWWLHGIGDWKVICIGCAKTHEIVVRPKDGLMAALADWVRKNGGEI
jgi:hypothetical protein